MIRGSQGAMQWIFDSRTYGMKIQYTSTAPGNVDWVGDQIRYKQIEFSMNQLRSMVHGLVFEIYRALERVLYVSETDFPAFRGFSYAMIPPEKALGIVSSKTNETHRRWMMMMICYTPMLA